MQHQRVHATLTTLDMQIVSGCGRHDRANPDTKDQTGWRTCEVVVLQIQEPQLRRAAKGLVDGTRHAVVAEIHFLPTVQQSRLSRKSGWREHHLLQARLQQVETFRGR